MPRGGKRKGAGRNSSWKNSQTCVIRVPEVLSERLMEIAHKLDAGEVLENETESKQISMDFLDGPGPLGQRDLAKRFQLRSNGTVGTNKKNFDWRKFAKWAHMHDPDDLYWAFDESIRKYRVIDYAAELAKETLHYRR